MNKRKPVAQDREILLTCPNKAGRGIHTAAQVCCVNNAHTATLRWQNVANGFVSLHCACCAWGRRKASQIYLPFYPFTPSGANFREHAQEPCRCKQVRSIKSEQQPKTRPVIPTSLWALGSTLWLAPSSPCTTHQPFSAIFLADAQAAGAWSAELNGSSHARGFTLAHLHHVGLVRVAGSFASCLHLLDWVERDVVVKWACCAWLQKGGARGYMRSSDGGGRNPRSLLKRRLVLRVLALLLSLPAELVACFVPTCYSLSIA